MFYYLGLLVISILCFNNISCDFYKSSYVKELTPFDFKYWVVSSDDLWVVEFYATWCKFCQELKPEFLKAAKALHGIAKFAAVDAEKYQRFSNLYNVTGYPTLIIFGYDKRHPFQYEGGPTAAALRSAVFDVYTNKTSLSSLFR